MKTLCSRRAVLPMRVLRCLLAGGVALAATVAALETAPESDSGAVGKPWSGWRGADRDGRVDVHHDWNALELQPAWEVAIGLGHASPITDGERVYAFSRRGDDEVAAAYDLETGALVWEKSLAAPAVKVSFAARKHGAGPKTTPLLSDGLFVTYGMTGVLTGLEAATGKLRFRLELNDFEKATPDFGVASSPVLASCGIVVVAGHEEGGAVLCIDPTTGSEVWRFPVGASYASPLVAELDGVEQVVHLADSELIGLSAETGERLWSVPFKGKGYAQNEVTPLCVDGDVVVSGEKRPTTRLKIVRDQQSWEATPVWTAEDASPEMSTPVILGDALILHSHLGKGTLMALSASTGEVMWQGAGRYGEHSSLIAVGESHLVSLRSEGELVVFEKRGAELKEVHRSDVAASPTWAHPVVVSGGILIKDLESLRFLAFN